MARTDSIALVAPVCLLLGGVGGALLTNLVLTPSEGVDASTVAVVAPVGPATPDRAGASPGAALPAARVGLDPLADEFDSTPGDARREVELESDVGDAAAELPTLEDLTASDALVGELTALLRSGRVEQVVGGDRARLVDRLIDLYLEVGDPNAAYGILTRVDTRAGNWHFVANALRQAGQGALANTALAQAIRLGLDGDSDGDGRGIPMDVWSVFQRYQTDTDEWIDDLKRHAPEMVADLLQERASAGELSTSMHLDLVQSLTEAGRSEEALAELEAILASGETSIGALRALRELDPERAEQELEQLLASAPSDEIELEYFRLLADTDRLDEALAMIAEQSADGTLPGHLLREAMRSMDPDLIRDSVDAWVATAPGNASVQIEAARFYSRAGDNVAAADCYLGAYESAANGNGERVPLMPEAVAQAAPAAFRASLDRMTAYADNDDEFWGDIADGYWRIGDHETARQCWQRAADIDPGDGEWTGKLSAVQNGTDPL